MAKEKDTDIHEEDGLIFKGEVIGHADKESKVRRRDGIIFSGEEIGYVDAQGKIRRPDGIIFKGEVVGQVKDGNRAHAEDGLIFPGEEWGYVDDEGNIRQRDGIIFKGRIIGKMRGHNKAATLAYFVLRFQDLVRDYEALRNEVHGAPQKAPFLGKIQRMLKFVPEAKALGDFDGLISNLKQLENEVLSEVYRNLEAKKSLCSRTEELSYSSDWKITAEEMKKLQERWSAIGHVPKEQADELWKRFRTAVDRFFERRKQHFEQLEKERQANLTKKQALCSRAETLNTSTDWKATGDRLKQLQDEWNLIGPVPKEHTEALWRRFRAAVDKFYERRKAHFDALDKERQANLAKKQALCARAESLSSSTDWKATGEQFKQLQEQWNAIGPVPKELVDALWARFRAATDKFYERRQAHFQQQDLKREENLKKKQQICARAEALKSSTDWKSAGEQLLELQEQWKAIGPVPKEHSEALWERFCAALDTFYQRRETFFTEKNREMERNLREKERLCSIAESLAHSSDLRAAIQRVKGLQAAWKMIGHVPREDTDALWERFRSACDHVFEAANAERQRRQEERQKGLQEAYERKREQAERLSDSIAHDEENIARWQSTLYNLRPGGRADEIRDSLESKIDDVERRIAEKRARLNELEDSIADIRSKL